MSPKKFSNQCSFSESQGNQIMKFKVSGNVHFVYVISLLFDVIGRLYPKEQE